MSANVSLIGWWRKFQARVNGAGPEGTLASGILPGGVTVAGPAKPNPNCVYLHADTDYRKLAIALIEQRGYVVIEGNRKAGRPAQSSKKAGGIVLPTGITLREHVRVVKEDALKNEKIKLQDRAALRRILEGSIGHELAEQGKSAHAIKTTIDRELRNLERRLREARRPRRRK